MDADAANLFFQLISDRYEQGSLIITSNLPFSQWGEIPGSTTIATAIIDRVVHHAQVLQTSGESYRLRNHDQPNPVK
nr:ATP-binding protein [uncultured Mobiluncus sp.]